MCVCVSVCVLTVDSGGSGLHVFVFSWVDLTDFS